MLVQKTLPTRHNRPRGWVFLPFSLFPAVASFDSYTTSSCGHLLEQESHQASPNSRSELVRSKGRRWFISPGSDKKNCWSPAQWPAWTSAMASFSHRPQCGFPPGSLLRLQRTFLPPLPRTSLQCLCSPRSHFCSPRFQSSEVKPESGIVVFSLLLRKYSLFLETSQSLSNTRNTQITLFWGKQYLFEVDWETVHK